MRYPFTCHATIPQAALLATLLTRPAAAHVGDHERHPDWWMAWSFDPLIIASLALVTWVYLRGLRCIWRRAGVGRGIARWQAGSFIAGIAALVLALLSPIDTLAAELSSIHMVQHMLLMMIAAPLLVLGSPILVATWALPPRGRRIVNRWRWRWTTPWYLLWHPVTLLALYAITLWIWHLPTLYHAALRNPWVHDLQHLAFLVTACLFWRVLIDPLTSRRLSLFGGAIYLFATSLHASMLGVFMALSPRVWYSDYEATVAIWNLTALQDQQLAGLIMWMPACTLYAAVVATLFGVWLNRLQSRQRDPAAPRAAPNIPHTPAAELEA